MLRLFNNDRKANLRIRIYASEVEKDSFLINLESWWDSILYETAVSWVAVPQHLKDNILMGKVKNGCSPAVLGNTLSGRIQYPDGMFEGYRPTIHLFINDLDFGKDSDVIIRTYPSNITDRGFDWNVSLGESDRKTCCYGYGITYVVL